MVVTQAKPMEHYYKTVTGWAAFADLYVWAVQHHAKADRPNNFVEVGSWLGRSAALMGVEIINSKKDIEFYCIDPWIDGGPDLRNTKHYKQLTRPPFELFTENTRPVAHVITPLQGMSVEMAAHFEDGTVDFLMLDGDHSYEAVKADIEAWMPKMRKGGIISGDDYLWPGVKKAVQERWTEGVNVVVKKRDPDYLKSASYWSVHL